MVHKNDKFEDIYNEIIKSEINIHYHSEIRFNKKNNELLWARIFQIF
jgi:hypothetical protein